ncbi:MAG TPA: tetrahydromethanopterin S-methyltransferase subunit H [Candidatus Deferrimicrobium sp.]|nr:tetrahydromethanopterin S-methyltransferase subunit H [Candidatus Deferrimicrobium sp.]
MFIFSKEQKIFQIGKIQIGGQPGQNPPVLIGSIFFKSHKIVIDDKKGDFNRNLAESLINTQDEIAEKTGIPAILDVVGEYSEALIRYIEFIKSITDTPLLMDGVTARVRIPVCQYLKEAGLTEGIIYNSIEFHSNAEELAAIKNAGIKQAVLLAYGPRFIWPKDKLKLIAGEIQGQNLLQKAQEAGVEKILIDTAVLDPPSIGISARAIYLIKEELGYPAGTAPCNAIYTWSKGKEFNAVKNAIISTSAMLRTLGADFILYGSINNATMVFPAIAMVESCIAYNNRREFKINPSKNHPITKIF